MTLPGAAGLAFLAAFIILFLWLQPSTAFGDDESGQECADAGDPPTPTDVAFTEAPIVVDSTVADYFVLYVSNEVGGRTLEYPVRVVRGGDGTTTLEENVAPLAVDRYRVEKYQVANPADIDGDCIDDITELDNLGTMNPVNPAATIELVNGALSIPDWETYETIVRPGSPGRYMTRFVVVGMDTPLPRVYFQNSNTFLFHAGFMNAVGIDSQVDTRGTLAYDPDLVAPDGSLGVFRYRLWNNRSSSFNFMERLHTLLASSLPILDDNLAYRIPNAKVPTIREDLPLYRESRIEFLFDDEVYGDVDFLALNPGEGYGLLRVMDAGERPNSRDVVIYKALPNEMPRVAGIISVVPQTQLSHVNLRAQQNRVPNAFIRGALEDDDIDDLIDSHVYYSVTQTGYTLRAATQEEVDRHYAASRPVQDQTPERDLTATTTRPLSEIGFDDWDAFGVKAANVAVLGTLGFPAGTVPDGFAIPFYFYDEFMKHNGFYSDIEEMLADEDFRSDYDEKADELKKLRKKIKKGDVPAWIETALTEMHATFDREASTSTSTTTPISLRYRSSTNNEDLPNFSGAGLYDSKTQHPEETVEDGISKSLKQVYASLWNFRAFVERDFHRIDHMAAAMGVLVHPNYSDEKVNGVAVSVDPVYGTDGTYYVNSQVGEDLVTNPETNSTPEEILLNSDGTYRVVAFSNQVPAGDLLMTDAQIGQLRLHLVTIHNRFKELYEVEEGEPFAMEIEFKITVDNVLAIKQARPWVFSPLKGRIDSVPKAHEGIPFSVRFQFSEGIAIDVDEFRDHAVEVTGGRVTDARRLAGTDDWWEIEVVPNSIEDVTIVLASDRPCTEDGAICTSNGVQLSTRLEHTLQWDARMRGRALWAGIVELEWSNVPGADSYEVRYYRREDYSWVELPGDGIEIAFYNEEGAVVKNLSPTARSRFRVSTLNADGTIQWYDFVSLPSTRGPASWRGVPEPVNSAATGAPAIDGTPRVHEELTASVSRIGDENGLKRVKFHYQWIRIDGANNSDIAGATEASYTLTAEDVGKSIGVRVSFVDRRGYSESLTSEPVFVNTPATGLPTIAGNLRVGEMLTADTTAIVDGDGLDNVAFRYQWVRGDGATDSDIQDATDSTYILMSDDEGETIKVRVSFTDDAGNYEALIGAMAAKVEPAAGEVVWEAELTAGLDTGVIPAVSGYSVFGDVGGSLSSDELAFDGKDYYVNFLAHSSESLWLAVVWKLPVDFTLRIGDSTYVGSESKSPPGLPRTIGAVYWWPSDTPDWLGGDPVQVSLTVDPSVELGSRQKAPVTGNFRSFPTEHDGREEFTFRISFDEGVVTTADALRDHVLTVSNGMVSSVEDTSYDDDGRQWRVTVQPKSKDTVAIEIEAGLDCQLEAAICASDGRRLFNHMTLTVAAKPNSPAAGIPVITGTAQVGETLTADTSAIEDADGLDSAILTYQWLADDTEIAGAAGSRYVLTSDDEGKTVKVRVSFTDDGGNDETLTSVATAAVTVLLSRSETTSCPDAGNAPTPVSVAISAMPVEVQSTEDDYFVLYVSHRYDGETIEYPVRVVRGRDGTTTLEENVAALPVDRYRVEKYMVANPADVDGDCMNDIAELDSATSRNPVNPGHVATDDGVTSIPDWSTFESLAHRIRTLGEYSVKFSVFNLETNQPSIYFQDTKRAADHGSFLRAIGLPLESDVNGVLVYDESLTAPDGIDGIYRFTFYSNFNQGVETFNVSDAVYTLIAANMEVLDNNLALWKSRESIQDELALYQASRMNLVFDEDVTSRANFIALNAGEGYGMLRQMDRGDRPHERDIVIYETLPNELARVAGIISTVPQTPLSHVNLRATQDNIPNAYIRDALKSGNITSLLDTLVYYEVNEEGYSIRAATPEEVESHHALLRPSEDQTPERDLSVTTITPLSDVGFDDWTAFGVKAANVAELSNMDLPDSHVPDGFAIPFYFYDEFMKHNDFYSDIEDMLADPEFQSDYDEKASELKKLRKKIKKGDVPGWMETALTEMHATFDREASTSTSTTTPDLD